MISRLLILLTLGALAFACDQSPKIPGGEQQNYPGLVTDSSERRAKAEREWRRMLDAYGVPQTPPDLYPIIYTPRSLLGVSGGIKITPAPPQPVSDSIALREAVKGFVDRWRELIGADPTTISLVSADESGNISRFTYRQANYALPIAGIYGEMTVVVSKDGRLMQLDDRFIPAVELPVQPKMERDAAARKVVGRTFAYTDIAGREQRVRISDPNEVSVKQLVILPIEKADSIEVHLAWEVIAGTSLSWTVYIDAITGEEIKVTQNFQT